MTYTINEGQQAEEYKARKAKEKEDKLEGEENRFIRRYLDTDPTTREKLRTTDPNKAERLEDRAYDMAIRNAAGAVNGIAKNSNNPHESYMKAKHMGADAGDAILRHMRRHPDQYKESCGIFTEVYFI